MRTGRNFYYQLKPYLPWRFRMAVRGLLARRQRKAFQAVWPIDPASAQPPAGWPGWPDGKKFAFVLTHDVEGPKGVAKCRQLMQLEKELGFHSSFNFIPEGDYAVSRELRAELVQNGFEVGVHDLHHDGKLYQSRQVFSDNARQINCYMKEWGVTGFRSGFMLHRIDWLHDLDIQYDASTFDTDPCEPQPDGTHTIFPFWVPRPAVAPVPTAAARPPFSDGYIELSYTLPQDSTMFFVLREPTPEIWLRKLDWIAQQGGMALLNVHPDYLQFPGEPSSPNTYPVARYLALLEHLRKHHAGVYWHPLPCEMAAFCAKFRPQKRAVAIPVDSPVPAAASVETGAAVVAVPVPHPEHLASPGASENPAVTAHVSPPGGGNLLRGRHAAVVLFSDYPADPRPRRAAEALAQQGMTVDLICLQENPQDAKREMVNGVDIFRVPLKRRRGGKLAYIYQYSAFTLASFILLALRSFRRRYDLVHVHNMPDFLVLSALIPKLYGAKVILDLHDPMPELMISIFNLPHDSLTVRALKQSEKWSIWFADLVLTPNTAFKTLFVSRGCPPDKMQLIMNSPEERIFQFKPAGPSPSPRDPARRFVVLYHGFLAARHGLDLAIDALKIVRKTIPNVTFVICGESTPYFEKVMNSLDHDGLREHVRYLGRRNLTQIVEEIKQCDVGIIPNRRTIFTEINMPTRIFECLSQAKPVIAPATHGIQDYFSGQDLIFFEPDNVVDLARRIEYVALHPQEVHDVVQRGQAVYQKHLWRQERSLFLQLVSGLIGGRADARHHEAAMGAPEIHVPDSPHVPGPEGLSGGSNTRAHSSEAALDSTKPDS